MSAIDLYPSIEKQFHSPVKTHFQGGGGNVVFFLEDSRRVFMQDGVIVKVEE